MLSWDVRKEMLTKEAKVLHHIVVYYDESEEKKHEFVVKGVEECTITDLARGTNYDFYVKVSCNNLMHS